MIPSDWLTHAASRRPDGLAVRDREGRTLSYQALHRRATDIGRDLASTDQLLVLEIPPGVDHAIGVHAAIHAGVPFQTVRPGLPEAERQAALAGSEEPRAVEVLCRVLTSGTSGARKPISLTRENHFSSAAASALRLGVDPDDRWLCCVPVDHIAGLSILVRSLIYGTAAVVHAGFDLDAVRAELAGDITLVSLVPTQLQRLLAAGAPLERARVVLVGGGPVSDAALAEAEERGANVVQTYGLTEACSQVCTLSPAEASRKRGSAGRPLDGTVVEIEDSEILVGGPTLAPGAVGDDGLLRTGDRGRLDEDGFLWVEGRLDDLIVTGGENVTPEEVEEVLLKHPAVADAAVFGRPDPEWGSAVTAAVVLDSGASADAETLRTHCRSALAGHKVPKVIEVLESLPRTATGKLLRRELV